MTPYQPTTLGQGMGMDFIPQNRAAAIQRELWLEPDDLLRWLEKFYPVGTCRVHQLRDNMVNGPWLIQHCYPAVDLAMHEWLVYHNGRLQAMTWQQFAMFRGTQDEQEYVEPITAASSVSNEELAAVIKEERDTAVRDALFKLAQDFWHSPTETFNHKIVSHAIYQYAEKIGVVTEGEVHAGSSPPTGAG